MEIKKMNTNKAKLIIDIDIDEKKYVDCGVILINEKYNKQVNKVVLSNKETFDNVLDILKKIGCYDLDFLVLQEYGECMIEKDYLGNKNIFTSTEQFLKQFSNITKLYEKIKQDHNTRLLPKLVCVTLKTEKSFRKKAEAGCRPD